MGSTWYDSAASTIAAATAALPADMPLAERIKAVDASYPFGDRKMFPYKAWLRARRKYLVPFGYVPKGAPGIPLFEAAPESPLQRAKRRAMR